MYEASEPDTGRLARRLTAHAVLAHHPAVPDIAADYWEMSRDHYRAVDGRLADAVAGAPDAGAAYRAVLADPDDAALHHLLAERLERLLAERPHERERLAGAVAGADPHIWIDYHLGGGPGAYGTGPVGPDGVAEGSGGDRQPGVPDLPEAHVVIPFRDREGGTRTRNLLACLRALADQAGGAAHRVTLVEADTEPRTRALVDGLVDDYVFAYKDGLFNKAWAVNVGAVAHAGAPALCVLDADILVDRSFVHRNVARLYDGGHAAHLPFTWSLSLDERSTLRAIGLRNGEGRAEVPTAHLRGLLLREPPGGCVWTRTETFHEIGGFDERYEGWGGEDDDMVARLSAAAPLIRYDDPLLHLNHTRPAMTRDGVPFNAHLEPMSWSAGMGYGDAAKFRDQKN
ncbi:galactosyltransferase-related protein [Streptomyces sp. NPDC003036]|uniref:glycosyltransferase n=1 Tax=Streptomyces sp. NPDC003036 TaxID=3154442 RepID=UPI0033B64B99